MTEQQAALIFFKIKVAFPFFDANEDAEILWTDKLMKCDESTALINLEDWIENQSKAPHIADIIKKQPLSIYDIQAIEQKEQQLALEAYHKDNEVVPMPDHIREQIAESLAKMNVQLESGKDAGS